MINSIQQNKCDKISLKKSNGKKISDEVTKKIQQNHQDPSNLINNANQDQIKKDRERKINELKQINPSKINHDSTVFNQSIHPINQMYLNPNQNNYNLTPNHKNLSTNLEYTNYLQRNQNFTYRNQPENIIQRQNSQFYLQSNNMQSSYDSSSCYNCCYNWSCYPDYGCCYDGYCCKSLQCFNQCQLQDCENLGQNLDCNCCHGHHGHFHILCCDCSDIDCGCCDCGSFDCGDCDCGGLNCGCLDCGGLDCGGLDCGGLDCGGLDNIDCGNCNC